MKRKNPDPLEKLPKSIFWVTEYISPITAMDVMAYNYKGKEKRGVTAQHANCKRHWHSLFEDYFASRKSFLDTITPGKSYVYIEQKHWLKHRVWLALYYAYEFLTGWLPRFAEKYACRNGYEKFWQEDKAACNQKDYRFWQWIARKQMVLMNYIPFGGWRKAWVIEVPRPKLEVRGVGKKKKKYN
jgi:hypothetical protein